jgi:hypothetical protein
MEGNNNSDHDAITSIIKNYLINNNMDTSGVFDFLAETVKSFKSRLDINDDVTILEMSIEEKY